MRCVRAAAAVGMSSDVTQIAWGKPPADRAEVALKTGTTRMCAVCVDQSCAAFTSCDRRLWACTPDLAQA